MLMSPAVAVIVTAPEEMPRSDPESVESFEIWAMFGLEELQVTDGNGLVLPSLKVPVATRRCVSPGEMEAARAATAMETRSGGVRVPGL